jgi:hypothetical protein
MELRVRLILELLAEREAAMSESEMRFAPTRDRILIAVATVLAVAIIVVMRL